MKICMELSEQNGTIVSLRQLPNYASFWQVGLLAKIFQQIPLFQIFNFYDDITSEL